jgi:PAS domain S-box-containing protein
MNIQGRAAVATRMSPIPGPSGYVLVPLRESADFTLYRGRQHGNPSPVLVVAPTAEQPLPQSLRRLEHEYSLAAELEPAWAAKPLALTRHEGRTILVLADPGGEPLDRVLEWDKEQPLDLARILRIAINLATALGHAHQRGLIHKDLKPENVLVDDTGNVWLTGFGIASRLPRERQSPEPPEFIAGTLTYMAPEQTGRMNRSMDTRSDLYSLGVILYQMLTGVLPFAAADPLEWVHCHIARQPVAPADRRAVPEPLSAITMRLLAKNAEERYQTAAGLEADLRRCLEEWQSHGRIDPFPLGTDDTSDRLLIPEKLYGREREVDALRAAFDRVVVQGTAELVLVSGYSGVGKSSVVNELHKVLVPPRGLFAAGKFDQYKRDVPYAALAHAFQMLVRQILVKNEAEVDQWRHTLLEALGSNGQLIINLIPKVEFVIGKQPPVAELPPQEARGRFQLVFRRFLGAFARPEHPLALFLDDLQWLDTATLELLERLITDPGVRHVLLIGAYRDNEVNSSHPLMRTLAAIREAGAKTQEIVLAPLGLDDVERLIADALRCGPNSAGPLAQSVHEKTGGNPFFGIRFLVSLAEEGLLAFDQGGARWSWDLNRIRAKGYTDNVVDLMVGKLRRLRQETQSALQHLSCLGHTGDIAMLAQLFGKSEEQVHADLWEAVRLELVERTAGSYRFVHDRIQEAAYSLIPEESRAAAHLRIGRLLATQTPPDQRTESIFEIVNQLNRGAALISSPEEREELAGLNLIAGQRAKSSAAYASALTYLVAGAELLPEDGWDRRHDLAFALEVNRAECEYVTAQLGPAEERLTALAARAATLVERAAVTALLVDLYMTLDKSDRAITVGLEHLRQLGINWSAHPSNEQVRREYEGIWSQLGKRAIEDLIELPVLNDPASLATLEILTKLGIPAFNLDRNLHALASCRAVNLSLELGNCAASCPAYVSVAIIAGARFGDYQAGYRFGRLACELAEQRGWKRFQPRTYSFFGGLVVPWTRPFKSGRDLLCRAIEDANRIGDVVFAVGICTTLCANMLAAGDHLVDVEREAERGFAEKARFGQVVSTIAALLGLVRTLRGLTRQFGRFDDEQFEELAAERRFAANPSLQLAECMYWIRKLQARFLAGDVSAALHASQQAERLLRISESTLEEAEYHFYTALSRAACCDSVSADYRPQHLEALASHQRQIEIWAQNCPENFENRAALVAAEFARIEGRLLDAEQLYEKAIRSAHANGLVHNEAVGNEVAARFYAARGFEKIAHSYLRDARYYYQRWGADGKVRQLDELFPHLSEEKETASGASTIATPVEHLELQTVIKVSQAVSAEMDLDKLIDRVMRAAIEHAGAARGLLILLRGDGQQVEAEATTIGDKIRVQRKETALGALPQSIINYVVRTQEFVILDDASADNVYSKDEYVRQKESKSILCLPIVTQAKLVGALYLENNLTACAFTPDRVTVLQLLASQAAISLENAGLYSDLQRSEAFLAQGQTLSHTGSFGWSVLSGEIYWSEETFRIFQYDRVTKPTLELAFRRIHPGDRDLVQQTIDHASKERADLDFEHRLMMPDGSVKHLHVIARVLTTSSGQLEYVGAVTDVTATKQAEEKIQQSEVELLQVLELTPQLVAVLMPDRSRVYTNKTALDYCGCTLEEWLSGDRLRFFHPDDWERITSESQSHFPRGLAHEYEARLRRKDGQYRWILFRWSPIRDEQGQLLRWYVAGTDIEDRKQAEQRLQNENVALREEIDRASMFEEIVGKSPSLQTVLSRISKVAPADSSVLITGETGTGKELVARAIHKRSRRSSRPFVSVNCAATPRELIASELFGHEKGAFTGATQRRLGRFELAEEGTIFLDEIGELPAETQIALLRVLQEHEFERVGGTGSIRTNARVIAATNRDLEAAIAAGKFRSDLFYRLNVFPIEIPPLRERREDIPLLVGYFIDRYARKSGKYFQALNKNSLDALQSYPWPGNIRELQNVIERSVIVCETEKFSVDESWLSRRPSATEPKVQFEFSEKLAAQEKEMIEAALRETGGRVYGSSGAAAKLGMPGTTLDSKIKTLKISKNRFKTG